MRAMSCVQRLSHSATRLRPLTPCPLPLTCINPRTVVCRSMFSGPGSDKLIQRSCGGACSKETPLVPDEELPELLAAVPAWIHDKERRMLIRKFTAKNFMAGVRYFSKVAEMAESEGHHPDLHLTNYRDVEVHVTTHAAGGLTIFDFILAAKIDTIEVEYSPKWLQQALAAVPTS